MGSQDDRTHDDYDDGGGGDDGELTLLGATTDRFMQQMGVAFDRLWQEPHDAAAWRHGCTEYLVHWPNVAEMRVSEYDGPSTGRDVELARMQLAKLFDTVWDRDDVAVLVGDLLAGDKALWVTAGRIRVVTPRRIRSD